MNSSNNQPEQHLRKFQVQVGHHRLTIEAASEEEARRIARRQLSTDLPRLWDMIYDMHDTDFDVTQMG